MNRSRRKQDRSLLSIQEMDDKMDNEDKMPSYVPENTDYENSDDRIGTNVSDSEVTSPKETQVAATLTWLSQNYELSDGVCLPRCVLYVHYLDFCKRHGYKPAGAATFGKLIRQKFKNITTRRLGTRGQSKYHYYGIGIKESSIYYQAVYTGKGLTRFSGVKIKTEGSNRKYSLTSKTGTLLPEFPSAHNLLLPSEELTEKMHTFIMMYRTHSQRILDTVITANFEEIHNLLIHFWQGYPQHLQDILDLEVTVDVIAVCDSILYKVLTDVLVPNAIQDLPENLSSDLRAFIRSFSRWVESSLDDQMIPVQIREVKQKVLQRFLRSLTRHLTFIKIAQTARPHLSNSDVTTKALNDLDLVDFEPVRTQIAFALNDKTSNLSDTSAAVFDELKGLLRKQSQVEALTEWLDTVVDKCVLQQCGDAEREKWHFQSTAGKFVFTWSMAGALVMKDLTLNNAKSFSFLHLLKMTLEEYVFLVLETQTDKHRDHLIQNKLQKHMKNAEEIKMSAKIRTQANRFQCSPKGRKRKAEAAVVPSEDEVENIQFLNTNGVPVSEAPPTSSNDQPESTAFSCPQPSNLLPPQSSANDMPAVPHYGEVLRPPAINATPLPLSPIKHFPSYERSSYLPPFGLNPYNEYVNHNSPSFAPPRHVQPLKPEVTPPQPYGPISFNPSVSHPGPAPPTYWTDSRSHPASFPDPYAQLSYNSYPQAYDAYKKNSIFRGSVYQDRSFESITRTGPSAFDGLSRTGAGLDNLSRTNLTFDSLGRPNTGLDSLGRTNSAFDPSRSMYYPRPPENFQGGPLPPVACYSNSFMEITPPSGQYTRQEGFLYHDDVIASNMAAASGLTGFPKSCLSTSFR